MRVLKAVEPTREQLPLVLNDRPGVAVIRGAAGSGKTTTSLLRLRQLCAVRRTRRTRLGLTAPVRVLVLTFNRSLAGYVEALAAEQVSEGDDLILEVRTFAKWASALTPLDLMDKSSSDLKAITLGTGLGYDSRFLLDELDYVLGRFDHHGLEDYLTRDREGRGLSPRVDKRQFLTRVVLPFVEWKADRHFHDWHDLALSAAKAQSMDYDVIIVDEAQDFSANQIRAVLAHLAEDGSLTFVLDTVQRIYPRFHTWREVGLNASTFVMNARLSENKRNTQEIAAFARPLVEGLSVDENGELPDLESATEHGELPIVFGGRFADQLDVMVSYLARVNLADESVGILHPLGGGWFSELRKRLRAEGIEFVELSQNRTWPTGSENVGLSTLHSAKGLEFDHVILCGITAHTAGSVADLDDTALQLQRRLFAMGVGRAKVGVLFAYDPRDPAGILDYLDKSTYQDAGSAGLS